MATWISFDNCLLTSLAPFSIAVAAYFTQERLRIQILQKNVHGNVPSSSRVSEPLQEVLYCAHSQHSDIFSTWGTEAATAKGRWQFSSLWLHNKNYSKTSGTVRKNHEQRLRIQEEHGLMTERHLIPKLIPNVVPNGFSGH